MEIHVKISSIFIRSVSQVFLLRLNHIHLFFAIAKRKAL